jgi:hypothetical protein
MPRFRATARSTVLGGLSVSAARVSVAGERSEQAGPAVRDASLAVIRDAQEAGVWLFAGGVYPDDEVSVTVVAPDGRVTDGAESKAYIAGVTIIDVPSREEALQWAAKSPPPAAVHKRSLAQSSIPR